MEYTKTKRFKKLAVEYLKNDDMAWREKEIAKLYWTPHEVMMEVEVTYFELMRRVKKCGIKPVFKRRGFVRYTADQIERLKATV